MADFQPPPTYALPVLVDESTGKAVFNPIWLSWFIDLTGFINSAGGLVPQHNSLSGLQGGTTAEFYHFTQAQHTTLAALAALTGLSVTITTAVLTPTGAQGSMTFTSGLLTAQTQAT